MATSLSAGALLQLSACGAKQEPIGPPGNPKGSHYDDGSYLPPKGEGGHAGVIAGKPSVQPSGQPGAVTSATPAPK